MKHDSANCETPWPHHMAVALACATFPLIWVGGLVTTYDAGMAVPDWPTTYGYNLFLYPLATWVFGPWDLFIEHGHRLLGALVGLIAIALSIVIWRKDERLWMRRVAVAALLLVILQGVLGGMRVRLNSTEIARLHGCVGPLFFAFTIAICVWTSRFWRSPGSRLEGDAKGLALAWMTVVFAYFQLVVGALLRHPSIDWTPTQFRGLAIMHLLFALLLVVQVLTLSGHIWRRHPSWRIRRPMGTLMVLIFTQIALGVATWTVKYGWPTWLPGGERFGNFTLRAESMLQAITVTAHVATGSLFLAASVWLAMRITRVSAVGKAAAASMFLTQGAVA